MVLYNKINMKIQPYIEKLVSSNQYKEFMNKYKDAFLAAGFFVIDLESGSNIHQIDYYIPSKRKFAAFTLDNRIGLQILDSVTKHIPEKLDMETKIDLDALPGILEDEMKNRSITEDIKKIIAVIQNIGGKKVWNINSVLSGMDILKAHIDDASKTILKMEKTSFVDIMKRIPMDQMQQMSNIKSPVEKEENKPVEEQNENQAISELEKLDKLEEAIQKEKSRLKKEIIEEEKKSSKDKNIKVQEKIKNPNKKGK